MSTGDGTWMLGFYRVYQYVVPLVLFPVSYVLWLRRFDHDHRLVLLALSMPVLFAYVIPAIGTNYLKLWEFNTRWRLGRFRPHHGFVFGTASSLLALLCIEPISRGTGVLDVLRAGFVLGSVLALWNWLYDIVAIRAGFIVVYNRAHHERQPPEVIATDYAPVLFGTFGACYGLGIRLSQHVLIDLNRADLFWPIWLACNLGTLTIPVLAFVISSRVRNGDSGLRPYGGG